MDALFRRALSGEMVTSFDIHFRIPRTAAPAGCPRATAPIATRPAGIEGVWGSCARSPTAWRVEDALRVSEARHRALAEPVSDALLSIDEAGRIGFVNRHSGAAVRLRADGAAGAARSRC